MQNYHSVHSEFSKAVGFDLNLIFYGTEALKAEYENRFSEGFFCQFFTLKICLKMQTLRGLWLVTDWVIMDFGLFVLSVGVLKIRQKRTENRSDVLIDQAYLTLYFQNL